MPIFSLTQWGYMYCAIELQAELFSCTMVAQELCCWQGKSEAHLTFDETTTISFSSHPHLKKSSQQSSEEGEQWVTQTDDDDDTINKLVKKVDNQTDLGRHRQTCIPIPVSNNIIVIFLRFYMNPRM